jgi:hypothetical protein
VLKISINCGAAISKTGAQLKIEGTEEQVSKAKQKLESFLAVKNVFFWFELQTK